MKKKKIKYVQNVKKMQSYFLQCKLNFNLLNVLRPGKFLEMRLKISPLTPGVDFIVTITDNSQNIDKKKCQNNCYSNFI